MKRVVVKTEIIDKNPDGTTSTTKTHREEELSNSGLLEAWGYLILIFFTFLLFVATYRLVSSINQPTNQDRNYGFQER